MSDSSETSADAGPLTRVCSRCRNRFPAVTAPRPGQPEEWWLCPPCHDKLIGTRSKPRS